MEGELSPPFTASFWTQLKSTLVRNLIRKKRNRRHTIRVSVQYLYVILITNANKKIHKKLWVFTYKLRR
jgi:hypothetical protein